MRLRSFLTRSKIAPAWHFSPGGTVWRLELSVSGPIVGESRREATKEASWFCVDRAHGRPLWQDVTFPEGWWASLHSVHRDVVFIHGYAKPDMPEHRGIRALDLLTGRLLWEDPTLAFWFADLDRAYGYRTAFPRRTGLALEYRTGAVLEEYAGGVDDLFPVKQAAAGQNMAADIHHPEIFSDMNNDPRIAEAVRHQTSKGGVVGEVEFVTDRDFLVLNFHRSPANGKEQSSLENHLRIVDLNTGGLVYAVTLNKSVPAPVPDAFFLTEHTVMFVRDYTTLTAVALWRS